ncbi:ATP-grasp domain-containing protein [Chitinilyticum piscinae]|uniref:ATP-grasp domain-containing protein n=1 Tax=Chitinilyticum piscinae TaxID=2866724 RepID=A0A8J7FM88_9NEIS|nr:ATP-grasp domain-containing protein [Chitinilyticum piscinae]MBE9608819.1 ATP-grasp domain-containing protein [Chitinilyticum piscinae]
MNVLICSAARKVWLIDAFKSALSESGGLVFAADADPLAVALRVADGGLILPCLNVAEYEQVLLQECKKHNIQLIIPTRDAELTWFSERLGFFALHGIQVMLSSSESVRICQDKLSFCLHCECYGYSVPKRAVSLTDKPEYPLFARPRTGAGGRGTCRINDDVSLQQLTPWSQWLIQELIEKPEYTLDLFADFEGRVLSVVPRQRLRVVAGESTVGVTVEAPYLIERAISLAQSLHLVGHNTLQCFWDGGEPLWIEINPRYGGGASLGFAAGANTPLMLLRLLAGEEVLPCIGEYERGLYLYRYSTDLYVRGAM